MISANNFVNNSKNEKVLEICEESTNVMTNNVIRNFKVDHRIEK